MTAAQTILVIEDDPAYRDNMDLILRMEVYRIMTAADGISALALLRETIPDLILCDIMMPGMDGRALFEFLKQDTLTADIPFIFVTALGGRENIRSGMAAGADDYLTKPFTAEELFEAVRGRLERIRTLRHKAGAAPANQEVAWLHRTISRRECEVLLLVGRGATSKQIAEYLGISIRTVENHRTHLMEKLDAPNAAALAHWAGIAPHTFTWTSGSGHAIGVTSPQTAPGSRSTFLSWSDGGTQSHSITVPATATTYTAGFSTKYQLTTAITPAGSGMVLPLTGAWYAAGSTANVSVTPSTGYKFVSWSGPVANATSAATTVTMSGPQSVTANITGVPALTAKVTGKSGTIDTRLWTVTFSNTGTGTATAVSLTRLTVTPGAGVTCTPVVKSGFPVAVADVASGTPQTVTVTIDFTGCAPANKFSVQFAYTYGDGGGGSYTSSDSFYNMMR